jgi:uncharacterized protein
MSLIARVEQEIKEAMVAKNQEKLDTLRFLKSDIKYAAIEKKKDALEEAEILQVIQKQIKRHKESIEQFKKGGRPELVEKESRELAFLEAFLPEQLTDEQLEALARKKAQEAGATLKKDFGRMMKLLTADLAGQADAKRLSQVLGKILQ